jgi:hypothetical protein
MEPEEQAACLSEQGFNIHESEETFEHYSASRIKGLIVQFATF